jgi:hypothetical protein
MEASPLSNVPKSSGKPSQKSRGCYSSKWGNHMNGHDFEMKCSTRCLHTFGHVVYMITNENTHRPNPLLTYRVINMTANVLFGPTTVLFISFHIIIV